MPDIPDDADLARLDWNPVCENPHCAFENAEARYSAKITQPCRHNDHILVCAACAVITHRAMEQWTCQECGLEYLMLARDVIHLELIPAGPTGARS